MTIARKIAEAAAMSALAVTLAFVALILAGVISARAIDRTGLSDTLTQEQRDWVRGLRDKQGYGCCDDADGIDPEWRIVDERYEVKFHGEWLPVSDAALLPGPNKIGVARAWVLQLPGEKPFVRCFLPGPVT